MAWRIAKPEGAEGEYLFLFRVFAFYIYIKSFAVICCCAAVLRIQTGVKKSCVGIMAVVSNMSNV